MSQHSLLARLPNELLLRIFEINGQGPSPESCGRNRHPVPEHVRTIQSLRLTCRQFYEIAGLLLIPSIQIDFLLSSIYRLQQVSNYPLISRGIRTIKIMLDVEMRAGARFTRDYDAFTATLATAMVLSTRPSRGFDSDRAV
ncbi:hypothetical protein V8F33_003376 [Rhypophila sp. PSN 637]